MNRASLQLLAAFLLSILLLTGGCQRILPRAGEAKPRKAATREPRATMDSTFQKLSDEYIAGYLDWRPGQGTALGWHQYDGKSTDLSWPSIEKEIGRLRRFDRLLDLVQTNELSRRNFYDFRILRSAIRKELFKFEDRDLYRQNPMTYAGAISVNIYIKRNFAPLRDRVRSLTEVLESAPAVMAAARANLAGDLAQPLVETAIEVAQGSATFLRKDLVEALKGFHEPAARTRFEQANHQAIQELEGYAAWLKEKRLPGAHQNYALGREKYAKMLREGELILLSPDKLLELGLAELKKEQKTFTDTAHRIDPARKAIEVFKDIQKDHPTEEGLIPDTRRNLEAIRRFLVEREIVTIPSSVRPLVEETPQFDRATSFASMETPGPFETKAKEAYYYVTPCEKEWPEPQKEEWLTAFNYYTTDVVSIHEAYPGHYLQFLSLNASSATRVEKIFDSYAFVEGWAHYTEKMMLDAGFGPNMPSRVAQPTGVQAAKYRLAQSDEALLRLCRLCVSVQMHCKGMTVDGATRFFQQNCYYEEKPARQEAIRGTFDPEYLYYTLGKLQLLKLRRDFQIQEGAGFTLRRFHDAVLRYGMPPVRLLREVLLTNRNRWNEMF